MDDPDPCVDRGEKQAAKVAAWLDRQLPEGLRVIASPCTPYGAKPRPHPWAVNSKCVQNCCQVAPRKTCSILTQWPNARGSFLVAGPSAYARVVIAQLLACSANALCERGGVVAAPAARLEQSQTVLMTAVGRYL